MSTNQQWRVVSRAASSTLDKHIIVCLTATLAGTERLTGGGLKMGVYSVVGATAGAATGGADGLKYICTNMRPISDPC